MSDVLNHDVSETAKSLAEVLDRVEHELARFAGATGAQLRKLKPEEYLASALGTIATLKNHLRLSLYAATLEMDPEWRAQICDLHDKLDAGWEPKGEPVEDFVERLRQAL